MQSNDYDFSDLIGKESEAAAVEQNRQAEAAAPKQGQQIEAAAAAQPLEDYDFSDLIEGYGKAAALGQNQQSKIAGIVQPSNVDANAAANGQPQNAAAAANGGAVQEEQGGALSYPKAFLEGIGSGAAGVIHSSAVANEALTGLPMKSITEPALAAGAKLSPKTDKEYDFSDLLTTEYYKNPDAAARHAGNLPGSFLGLELEGFFDKLLSKTAAATIGGNVIENGEQALQYLSTMAQTNPRIAAALAEAKAMFALPEGMRAPAAVASALGFLASNLGIGIGEKAIKEGVKAAEGKISKNAAKNFVTKAASKAGAFGRWSWREGKRLSPIEIKSEIGDEISTALSEGASKDEALSRGLTVGALQLFFLYLTNNIEAGLAGAEAETLKGSVARILGSTAVNALEEGGQQTTHEIAADPNIPISRIITPWLWSKAAKNEAASAVVGSFLMSALGQIPEYRAASREKQAKLLKGLLTDADGNLLSDNYAIFNGFLKQKFGEGTRIQHAYPDHVEIDTSNMSDENFAKLQDWLKKNDFDQCDFSDRSNVSISSSLWTNGREQNNGEQADNNAVPQESNTAQGNAEQSDSAQAESAQAENAQAESNTVPQSNEEQAENAVPRSNEEETVNGEAAEETAAPQNDNTQTAESGGESNQEGSNAQGTIDNADDAKAFISEYLRNEEDEVERAYLSGVLASENNEKIIAAANALRGNQNGETSSSSAAAINDAATARNVISEYIKNNSNKNENEYFGDLLSSGTDEEIISAARKLKSNEHGQKTAADNAAAPTAYSNMSIDQLINALDELENNLADLSGKKSAAARLEREELNRKRTEATKEHLKKLHALSDEELAKHIGLAENAVTTLEGQQTPQVGTPKYVERALANAKRNLNLLRNEREERTNKSIRNLTDQGNLRLYKHPNSGAHYYTTDKSQGLVPISREFAHKISAATGQKIAKFSDEELQQIKAAKAKAAAEAKAAKEKERAEAKAAKEKAAAEAKAAREKAKAEKEKARAEAKAEKEKARAKKEADKKAKANKKNEEEEETTAQESKGQESSENNAGQTNRAAQGSNSIVDASLDELFERFESLNALLSSDDDIKRFSKAKRAEMDAVRKALLFRIGALTDDELEEYIKKYGKELDEAESALSSEPPPRGITPQEAEKLINGEVSPDKKSPKLIAVENLRFRLSYLIEAKTSRRYDNIADLRNEKEKRKKSDNAQPSSDNSKGEQKAEQENKQPSENTKNEAAKGNQKETAKKNKSAENNAKQKPSKNAKGENAKMQSLFSDADEQQGEGDTKYSASQYDEKGSAAADDLEKRIIKAIEKSGVPVSVISRHLYTQLVHHGSPYLFERFLLDFGRTGQGAMSHGWGLYFSKALATARHYSYEDRVVLGGKRRRAFYNRFSFKPGHKTLMDEATPTPIIDDLIERPFNSIYNFKYVGGSEARSDLTLLSTSDVLSFLFADISKFIDDKGGSASIKDIPIDRVLLWLENGAKAAREESERLKRAEPSTPLQKKVAQFNDRFERGEVVTTGDLLRLIDEISVDDDDKMELTGTADLFIVTKNTHEKLSKDDFSNIIQSFVFLNGKDNIFPYDDHRLNNLKNTARSFEAVRDEIKADPSIVSDAVIGSHMYEALVPSDELLLDEDKPVSEQSQFVQKALQKMYKNFTEAQRKEFIRLLPHNRAYVTGKEIYSALRSMFEDGLIKSPKLIYDDDYVADQQASLFLSKYGINGISYNGRIDGPCVVIWNADVIEMVKRYQSAIDKHPEVKLSLEEAIESVKKAFPGGKMEQHLAGTYTVTMPNGVKILFRPQDGSIINDSAKASAAKAHGLNAKMGVLIKGAWQRITSGDVAGILSLTENTTQETPYHESFHAVWDLALTEREKAAMLRYYAPLAKAEGKDVIEYMADAYAGWRVAREKERSAKFGKLWQKIKDFATRLYAAMTGMSDVVDTIRKIESGEVWKRSAEEIAAKAKVANENGDESQTAENNTTEKKQENETTATNTESKSEASRDAYNGGEDVGNKKEETNNDKGNKTSEEKGKDSEEDGDRQQEEEKGTTDYRGAAADNANDSTGKTGTNNSVTEQQRRKVVFNTLVQLLRNAGITVYTTPKEMARYGRKIGHNLRYRTVRNRATGEKHVIVQEKTGNRWISFGGFTVDSPSTKDNPTVALNAGAVAPEAPLHEYVHIWTAILIRYNPKLWEEGVKLLKTSPVWVAVANHPLYKNLSEEAIASEVLAFLSSETFAAKMSKKVNNADENSPALLQWLREYWNAVKKYIEKALGVDLSPLTLDEFINMPIADLLSGKSIADIKAELEKAYSNRYGSESKWLATAIKEARDSNISEEDISLAQSDTTLAKMSEFPLMFNGFLEAFPSPLREVAQAAYALRKSKDGEQKRYNRMSTDDVKTKRSEFSDAAKSFVGKIEKLAKDPVVELWYLTKELEQVEKLREQILLPVKSRLWQKFFATLGVKADSYVEENTILAFMTGRQRFNDELVSSYDFYADDAFGEKVADNTWKLLSAIDIYASTLENEMLFLRGKGSTTPTDDSVGIKYEPIGLDYLRSLADGVVSVNDEVETTQRGNNIKYSVSQYDEASLQDVLATHPELADAIAKAVQNMKDALPNCKFTENGDGTYTIEAPNGAKMLFKPMESIIVNAAQQERARKAHGIGEGKGVAIAGSWLKIDSSGIDGILKLSARSSKGTAFHEAFHAVWDLCLTAREKAALLRYYTPIAEAEGKNVYEVMADAYAAWHLAREGERSTKFGKLWQKIRDCAAKLRTVFTGMESVNDTMRKVESGEVWNRSAKEDALTHRGEELLEQENNREAETQNGEERYSAEADETSETSAAESKEAEEQPKTFEERLRSAVVTSRRQSLAEKAAEKGGWRGWLKWQWLRLRRLFDDRQVYATVMDRMIEAATGEKLARVDRIIENLHFMSRPAAGTVGFLIGGENEKADLIAKHFEAYNNRSSTTVKLKHIVTVASMLKKISHKEMQKKYPEYLKKYGFTSWVAAMGYYLACARMDELSAIARQVYANERAIYNEKLALYTKWVNEGQIGEPPLSLEYEEWAHFQRQLQVAHDGWVDNGKHGDDPRDEMRRQWLETHDNFKEPSKYFDPSKEPVFTPYKPPQDLTRADMRKFIDEAPAEIKAAAEDFYKIHDNLLSILENGGLISHERHVLLNKMYKRYCPLFRDFDEFGLDGLDEFLTRGSESVVNIKYMMHYINKEGNGKAVKNPMESLIQSIDTISSKAERNIVGQFVVEQYKKADLTDIQELKDNKLDGVKITKSEDRNLCVFSVFVNGKRRLYRTTPEIFVTLSDQDISQSIPAFGIASKLAIGSAKVMREGVTLSPSFIARNFFADTFQAAFTSRNGFVPIYDSIRGAIAYLQKGSARAEFDVMGVGAFRRYRDGTYRLGTLEEINGAPSRYATSSLYDLCADLNGGKVPTIAEILLSPLKWGNAVIAFVYNHLDEIGEAAEASARMGEYLRARKRGKGSKEATMDAAWVTTDFSVQGVVGAAINRYIPFFNACIQGGAQVFKILCDPEARGTACLAAAKFLILPSFFFWVHNHDEDWYKKLDPSIKYSCWCINEYIRLPKPRELGILFGGGVEAILDTAFARDPVAWKHWGGTFWDAVTPSYLPTILLPMIEWRANYSFFRGTPLVPLRLQNMPEGMQYTTTTSGLSKAIGGRINVSPVKIDNLVRGYTGTLGMLMWAGPDLFKAFDRPNATERKRKDQPFIRDFTVNSGTQTRFVNEFYDALKAVSDKYKGKGEAPVDYKGMLKARAQISKLNKEIRVIEESERLDPVKKRELIDKRRDKISDIAEDALVRFGYKHL